MNTFYVANLMIIVQIPMIFPVKLLNKIDNNKKISGLFSAGKEVGEVLFHAGEHIHFFAVEK